MLYGYHHSSGRTLARPNNPFLSSYFVFHSPPPSTDHRPLNRSPMADFGYDISNHTDVDPLFGSLADFDTVSPPTLHQR